MKLLRFGDIGAEVANLQRRLIANGHKVDQTHIYDEKTLAAVKRLQARGRLVVDGIYGPKTESYLSGSEVGYLLKQSDLLAASKKLGVDVASVMAVNEVESLGSGFIKQGQPRILFERHVFYRQLHSRKINTAPLQQRYPGIVNSSRGGYAGGRSEYTRLAVAVDIHRDAAYESASWGAFQIMGFHWKLLGFDSPQAFVDYVSSNEAAQLDLFVRFILADNSLHKALKEKKWSTFARIYNGPAYAENLYDVKIARAYKRYAELENEAA